MLSKRSKAALGAVVLVAGAAGAFGIKDLRFWAWASEIREIAGVSLTTAINQRYDFLALERRELRLCERARNDCTSHRRRIQRLEQEIKRLEAKRRKYQE